MPGPNQQGQSWVEGVFGGAQIFQVAVVAEYHEQRVAQVQRVENAAEEFIQLLKNVESELLILAMAGHVRIPEFEIGQGMLVGQADQLRPCFRCC